MENKVKELGTGCERWHTVCRLSFVFLFLTGGLFCLTFAANTAGAASYITQFGITWTFKYEISLTDEAGKYHYGTFVNRDYWIIPKAIEGPDPNIIITAIDPASTITGNRTINGCMLDVVHKKDVKQGMDSSAPGWDSSLNVGRPGGSDLDANNPLVIQAGHSLISSISRATAGLRPQVQDAAVLTILGSAPPANSFRPPYAGTDKTIKFNISDLDYSCLASLTPVASTPRLKQQAGDNLGDSVERMFERPWIEWQSLDYTHPLNNMPTYGTNTAKAIGDGALSLNLNYSNAEKETLMIRFVQLGIDLHALLITDEAPMGDKLWKGYGGVPFGRKLPVVFAAHVLNDLEMKNSISKTGDYVYSNGYGPGNKPPDYYHFAEDDQTFYIEEEDVYSQPYTLYYTDMGGGVGSKTGHVKVTHDSDTVEGVGTNWLSINLGSTKMFGVKDDVEAYKTTNQSAYIIKSIDSDTQLRLIEVYRGNTDQTGNAEYAISSRVWYGHGNDKYIVDTNEYTAADVNLPEWSPDHATVPNQAGRNWDMTYHGTCGEALCSITFPALIMGLKTLWNHDAIFDHTDRWMEVMVGQAARSGSDFSEHMWDAYRAKFGGVWTRFDPTDIYSNGANPANSDSVPPLYPTNLLSPNQTASSISLSWTAPGPASDGDQASGYRILRTGTMIGLTTATSFQDTGLTAQANYNYEVYSIDDAGNLSVSAATGTFSTSAKVNQPPNANAGVDKTVTDSDGNGSEQVVLDGSGSTDPDGTIQSYVWREGSSQIATSAKPTVTLSLGQHMITLTVTDNGGLADTDAVTITVSASGSTDNNPPSVTKCSPQPDSVQIPLNSVITLHVVDTAKGIDANSVIIKVNNGTVYTGNTTHYSSATGDCRRTGTKADYAFAYQPSQAFDFEQQVTVAVNAADLGGNVMNEYSYSFWTEMRSFGKNKKVSSGLDNLACGSPATTRDSSGNTYVVWHAGPTGSRDVYVSTLTEGAAGFGNVVQLTADPADQCNPAIALDSSDNLYIVWQDNRRGNWDTYMSSSADGLNWSAESRVSDSNNNEINPAIAIGSAGRATIVWQDDRGGNQDIYVASSSDGFATKTISQITSHSSNQVEPAIAVDSGDTVYVVWTDYRNGSTDIYGAALNNGWNNLPIVSNANNQSSPVIAAEAAGSILHLLWVDNTPGNNDIYYAATDGSLSSPLVGSNIIDDSSGANQLEPAIAVTGFAGNNLKVFACWQDWRNVVSSSADTDIYFVEMTSDGKTNVFVDDDGTNANQSKPALGVDRYGYPYIVWADSRNANPQAYYAGSTYLDPVPLASQLVSVSLGATVGTDPANITSLDDVSVIVPAGACSCDVEITISRIMNPPEFSVQCLAAYDFGPSGIQFNQPVTITIPYTVPASQGSAAPYWYNALTGALTQQGITDIRDIAVSPTLHALSFKTTHFTAFYIMEGTSAGGGGGGGGGCALSASGKGSVVEFLLPYIGLAGMLTLLKLRDARNTRARKTTTG